MTEITRDDVYKLICHKGINLLYFLNGIIYFPLRYWSKLFRIDIEPLPTYLSYKKMVKFIENERLRALNNGYGKVFYGFYKTKIDILGKQFDNIPVKNSMISDVLMKYDGNFLYNCKNRMHGNGQQIIMKDKFLQAWVQFFS